ncbi:hypothetical protein [Lacrimispora xylanolytica]|uniref:Uncharacterized protein n=1 Tax=Lacrimispora xylanolytica TaxID=29375 RepID=A0ABY7A5Z4_9FIRM|nr:hypothetical protein [Lacrimispora xylanolytica]WAJ22080.1 hypothetical protein OW255_10840 [Lacrimispora xylanolytica]
MLMEELLNIYDEKIFNNKHFFLRLKKGEKIIMISMLLCLIAYIILIFIFQDNTKGFLVSLGVVVILVCFLTWLNNKLYHKDMKEKIKNFKTYHLEELKKILKRHDHYYYSTRQIDTIIEWCDTEAQRESNFLTSIRPISTFAAVVFIPVSMMILDKCLGNEVNRQFISIVVIYGISYLLVFLLWLCYGPIIKDILNRRERMAEKLANDLRNLKLNEPRIPD